MLAQRIMHTAKGKSEMEDYEVPDPTENQVLLEIRHSVISPGTELAFLHGLPNTPNRFPIEPGYSACGTILKLGEKAKEKFGLSEGQRVAAQVPHASHTLVDANRCFPVSDTLPSEQAGAYRLVVISLQAIRKAQIQLGESAVILGLGPIGNLAAQLARAAGATFVLGIDPVPWRRKLGESSGLDAVTDTFDHLPEKCNAAHPEKNAYDVVIESSGVPEAINQGMLLARRLGRVILLGSTRGVTEEVNFYRQVHKKGLHIIGAHEAIRSRQDDLGPMWCAESDGRTAVALLESGRISAAPIITEVLPASQASAAYERLTSRDEQLMTIALDWTAS